MIFTFYLSDACATYPITHGSGRPMLLLQALLLLIAVRGFALLSHLAGQCDRPALGRAQLPDSG